MLEGCCDLLVRVDRDALGVGDSLVVQQQELLLRVVLSPGQGLFELEHTGVHLADLALGIRPLLGGLARDHRPERRGTLLGLGANGRRLLLGLVHLLGRVRCLALDARLVRRVLRVDAQTAPDRRRAAPGW